jgi:hypothetical protein
MESKVIFQDGMDNDPADFNNLEDFTQRSLDHIVGDGITAARKYAGFASSAASATNLSVLPGRYYSGGQVYNAADEFTYDFTTKLPAATKRIATLIAWGTEADTDSRPREFLINEETNASEPRVVAMEHARLANLSVALGAESADPVAPVLDSGVIAVANITLSPTGIESITMVAENAMDSVGSVADRATLLEGFRAKVEPQVASLGSDIAALTQGQAALTPLKTYGRALDRLATLEARVGVPSAAVDSFCDLLVDTTYTDTLFAGYDAKVVEGIRFANAGSATTQLAIYNPLNPAAIVNGGTLFPAYTRALRMSTGDRVGELQISGFTYQAHNLTQKAQSRHRVRHGPARTVSTAANYLKTGRFDVSTLVFRRDDEAWTVPANLIGEAIKNHHPHREPNHWEDSYEVPYWEEVTVASIVNGSNVAEVFLNSNDMILDAVGLTFTRLAADGNVTVLICETDHGAPVLDKVISSTTVDRASLLLNEETVIPVQPVFLTGGVRYALVVITAADHWLATSAGTSYPQGTLFYVLDGAYQQGDSSRDIMLSLYQAQFASSRTVIDLQPLTLVDGIADIDILAEATIPGSTQLTYEIQVGGVWYPLADVDASILGAGGVLPNLLAFRAVFTGTPDVMPFVNLTTSQVKISAPKTAFTYITATRNLPGAGSTNIHVTVRLEDYVEADHDLTATLLTGAGFVTATAPATTSDAVQPDGGIERTFVFALGAAVTAFKVKLVGATDSNVNVFHVSQRKDYAL